MKSAVIPNIDSSRYEYAFDRIREGDSGEVEPSFAFADAIDFAVVAKEDYIDNPLPKVVEIAVKQSVVVEQYIFCSGV